VLFRAKILFSVGLLLSLTSTCRAGKKNCIPTEEAARMVNREVCVSAHVYDVVELPDGSRFLDTCAPELTDDQCRFTILSLPEDREQVGDLSRYCNQEVQLRGVVHSMNGHAGMLLSHVRQFHGGAQRFRPSPLLLQGFDAESSKAALSDPNQRTQGHAHGFMNNRERETLTQK